MMRFFDLWLACAQVLVFVGLLLCVIRATEQRVEAAVPPCVATLPMGGGVVSVNPFGGRE
jgi:hypothetical protein